MILTQLASSISTLSLIRQGYETKSASTSGEQQYGLTVAQMQAIADEGDEKARAAKKIADAKEQLEFLRRGGFPPDVIARLAAQLAGQLQSAAAQLVQAIGATTSFAAAPNQAAAGAHANVATEITQGTSGTIADEERTNLVQQAYQSIAEDDGGLGAAVEDDDLLSEFEALVRQARQLERRQELKLQVEAS